ncbi:hypothetical protein LTR36_010659 [Oleoguttula mirabilis]|uniref:BHLH domain-containing protein n=1 Tax=Oleoguttula mirabilis TaxID=1507867 RepID=A0AAV9JR74_9PEZI|nr:hypothetical protein LTR36_010659 [Oleoguttula mirabilis]
MARNGQNGGHNGYGAENGYTGLNAPFGYLPDFAGDGMQLDNTPYGLNQQPILNPSETNELGDFFANPDRSKASNYLHDFQFGMDGKTDGNGLDNGMAASSFDNGVGNKFSFGVPAGTVDPTSTTAGTYGTNYQTHAGNPLMQFGSQTGAWPGNAGGSADEYLAANALSQMGANAIQGGTWGEISVGGVPAPGNSESPATSSRHSSGNLFAHNNAYHASQAMLQDQLRQFAPTQQQHYQQQPHQPTEPRARQQSLNLRTDMAQSFFSPLMSNSASSYLQHHSGRQGFYQYGGDPNIRPFSYAAPEYAAEIQGKEGNLMAVPLATQAANGHAHSHVMSQRTHHMQDMSRGSRGFQSSDSSPGTQYGGLPINNPSPTAANYYQQRAQQQQQQQQQWANRQAVIPQDSDDDDSELEERQPRKRRKSQMQRAEEAEYQPERQMQGTMPKRGPKVPKAEVAIDDEYEPNTPANTASLKRRRSNATAPASGSRDSSPDDLASPSPGDASGSKRRSRDSKSRSNLTEDQKRQNHIHSEQKRRNVIKQGYHDLNHLVPSLGAGKSGLSKSEVLKEAITYLENVLEGNEAIMERCGFTEEDMDPASETIEAY